MLNGRNPFNIEDAPHPVTFVIIYKYVYERNFLETSGPLRRRAHIPHQIQHIDRFCMHAGLGPGPMACLRYSVLVPWYGYMYFYQVQLYFVPEYKYW
jgi:hypothetical protein